MPAYLTPFTPWIDSTHNAGLSHPIYIMYPTHNARLSHPIYIMDSTHNTSLSLPIYIMDSTHNASLSHSTDTMDSSHNASVWVIFHELGVQQCHTKPFLWLSIYTMVLSFLTNIYSFLQS